ncbi:hypothetical protein CDAR_122491 [Caerostris darwini]|uniref:Uncharacterized protein n=1 Tax=Caerostris darwini TaxID=1538125 RepID=A0AAV4MDE5_9ARAC|nr:hypothetical protein CDAR_122491 [Caerostris darwini]
MTPLSTLTGSSFQTRFGDGGGKKIEIKKHWGKIQKGLMFFEEEFLAKETTSCCSMQPPPRLVELRVCKVLMWWMAMGSCSSKKSFWRWKQPSVAEQQYHALPNCESAKFCCSGWTWYVFDRAISLDYFRLVNS